MAVRNLTVNEFRILSQELGWLIDREEYPAVCQNPDGAYTIRLLLSLIISETQVNLTLQHPDGAIETLKTIQRIYPLPIHFRP